MAEPFKAGYLAIEESIKGIRSDGTTRSPIILYDEVTGDTIIRALDVGGSILFQDAAGDPLAIDVTVDWANVLSTPTTIAGYGITDAYTDTEVDTLLAGKSATGHAHAWADVSKTGSSLADLATRDATALTGTLDDARLSVNVPLKNSTSTQTFSGPIKVSRNGDAFVGNVAGAASAYLLYISRSDAGRFGLLLDGATNDVTLRTFTGSSGSEVATDALKFLNASGYARVATRLGIGVDPSYPLDVNGDARLSGVTGFGTTPNASWRVDILGGAALRSRSNVVAGQAAHFERTIASGTAALVIIKGGATPVAGANLTEWRNSADSVLAKVDESGHFTALSLRSSSFVELTDGTPASPAANKARIYWDEAGGTVKAVDSAGTTITLGSIGGAVTDAYVALAGDSGTASASGGATLSIVGAGGISTAAADGSPDTLTVTLGNHSAALLTSGELDDSVVAESNVTQHEAALSITATQLTGTVDPARISGSYTGITGLGTVTVGTWNADAVGEVYGGTSQTTYAAGDILIASAADTLVKLPKESDGDVLTLVAGLPAWVPPASEAVVCRVYRATSVQGIPDVTSTPIQWNGEDRDPHGYHDNATNNTRFTCPAGKDGEHRLDVALLFSDLTGGGSRQMAVAKNGAAPTWSTLIRKASSITGLITYTLSDTYDMAAGDYLEVIFHQSSGGTRDIQFGIRDTFATLTRIGD